MVYWNIVIVLTASTLWAQSVERDTFEMDSGGRNAFSSVYYARQDSVDEKLQDRKKPLLRTHYGPQGWELATRDGIFLMQLQWRMQFRYTHFSDMDPQAELGDQDNPARSFNLQRARIKVNGYAFRNWVTYYFEYDFPSSNLLHWRFTLTKFPVLQLRLGQWKANFSSERVVSSGKQQFVDRSLINKYFPVDIQQGIMLLGHVFQNTQADAWYYAGVFNGTGLGNQNDDNYMMWLGRYQWNFLGRDLALSFSDVEYHEQPTAFLALAGIQNSSPYTKFSTSGGGQLPGFEEGEPGQYDLLQGLAELAFKYRGFSFMSENHWKKIEDNVNLAITNLRGSLVMAGYFFHGLAQDIPKELELTFRYAYVNPNTAVANDLLREYTLGFNWFFKGHLNKLTLDAALLTAQIETGESIKDQRLRFQWDVSF